MLKYEINTEEEIKDAAKKEYLKDDRNKGMSDQGCVAHTQH